MPCICFSRCIVLTSKQQSFPHHWNVACYSTALFWQSISKASQTLPICFLKHCNCFGSSPAKLPTAQHCCFLRHCTVLATLTWCLCRARLQMKCSPHSIQLLQDTHQTSCSLNWQFSRFLSKAFLFFAALSCMMCNKQALITPPLSPPSFTIASAQIKHLLQRE